MADDRKKQPLSKVPLPRPQAVSNTLLLRPTHKLPETKNFRGAWSNTFSCCEWSHFVLRSHIVTSRVPVTKDYLRMVIFMSEEPLIRPWQAAPSLKRQCLFTVNSRSDAMVTAEYTKPWAEVTHTCDLDLCRSSLTHTSFQELEIPPRGQSANYTWHQRQGAWTPVGKMQINVLFSTIWSSNRRNYGCHKKIKIWLLMSPQIYGNTWIWEEINTWMER